MGIIFVVCSNSLLKFGMNEIQIKKKKWPHTVEHVHVSFATIIALLTLVALLPITDKVNSHTSEVEIHRRQKLCHFGCLKVKMNLFFPKKVSSKSFMQVFFVKKFHGTGHHNLAP